MKVFYGIGITRTSTTGQTEHIGGVEYTIHDGIVTDSQALLRDIKAMVQQAKNAQAAQQAQPPTAKTVPAKKGSSSIEVQRFELLTGPPARTAVGVGGPLGGLERANAESHLAPARKVSSSLNVQPTREGAWDPTGCTGFWACRGFVW